MPRRIAELINIKELYLSTNKIKIIPSEIGALKKLEIISFAENQLTDLPKEIYELKNLKEVYLHSNLFTKEKVQEIKQMFIKHLPHTKLSINADEAEDESGQ